MNGTVQTAGDTAITLGATTLAGNSTLDAAGTGALTTGAITGATFDLALDGNGGAVALDSFSGVGALSLVDATGLTVTNSSDATSVDLSGTQNGTYTFSSDLTADTLTTNNADADGVNDLFTLDLLGGLAIANAVAFDNNGDLQIGASTIGSTFTGGVSTTAVTGLVTLGGNITAPAGMTLGTATLIADTALDSDGGALTAGTITSNDAFALTLDGGSAGTVAVAGLANGGDLTILDSGSTTFSGAVNANTLTLTDTSGTIAVQGDLTVDTALVSQVNAYSVSLTGATNTIAGSHLQQQRHAPG